MEIEMTNDGVVDVASRAWCVACAAHGSGGRVDEALFIGFASGREGFALSLCEPHAHRARELLRQQHERAVAAYQEDK